MIEPLLFGWITPITVIVTIGCFLMFAYYIRISDSISTSIWLTMLGQSIVIAGKTHWDYTANHLLEPAPILSGAIMFLGGIILLYANRMAYSEVTNQE